MIVGGAGHVVRDNECRDDLCAIRLAGTDGARVEHNRAETRWWGIHVLDGARHRGPEQQGVAHDARGQRRRRERARQRDRAAARRALRHRRGRRAGRDRHRGSPTRGSTTAGSGCSCGKPAPSRSRDTAISAPRDHAVVSDRAARSRGQSARRRRLDARHDRAPDRRASGARPPCRPPHVADGIVDAWAPEALGRRERRDVHGQPRRARSGHLHTHARRAGPRAQLRRARSRSGSRAPTTSTTFPPRDVLHARRPAGGGVAGRSAPPARVGPHLARRRVRARRQDGVVHAARRRLTHEQFARHWTENHTPLALRHHVGLWNYTQNVVRRAFTPGGNPIDGVAELHFRTPRRLRLPLLRLRRRPRGDPRRRRAASWPSPAPETAIMRELPLRTRR